MSKTISILGATGSIGRQTLDVAEQLGLRVAALTANSNAERLEAQARKFRPRLAVLTDEAAAKDLPVPLAATDNRARRGPQRAGGRPALFSGVCPRRRYLDRAAPAAAGRAGRPAPAGSVPAGPRPAGCQTRQNPARGHGSCVPASCSISFHSRARPRWMRWRTVASGRSSAAAISLYVKPCASRRSGAP